MFCYDVIAVSSSVDFVTVYSVLQELQIFDYIHRSRTLLEKRLNLKLVPFLTLRIMAKLWQLRCS